MLDPARAVARIFVSREPIVWLVAASAVSVLQAVTFVLAGRAEHVLWIERGVGLFQNYGLGANLIANALLPYLARLYYDYTMKAAATASGDKAEDLRQEIERIANATQGKGRFVGTIHAFAFVGLLMWISNISYHVLGLASTHWGHAVFDSPDHPTMFVLNRINNFYSWVVIAPLCAHVFLWPTILLPRLIRAAIERGATRFELLHSDRAGGFVAVENAKFVFNTALAVIYLQVTLHSGTFRLAHLDHILVFIAATVALLFGNYWVFRRVDRELAALKEKEIEIRRRRVYEDDPLSFEILRFAYGTRPPHLLGTIALKVLPIAFSLAPKLAPILQLSRSVP